MEICRNDVCGTASLASLPEDVVGRGVSFDEPTFATLSVREPRRGELTLELWWNAADPRDGDRYSVEVVDVSEGLVVSLPETAVDYVDTSEDGLVGDECHSIQIHSEPVTAP